MRGVPCSPDVGKNGEGCYIVPVECTSLPFIPLQVSLVLQVNRELQKVYISYLDINPLFFYLKKKINSRCPVSTQQ